MGEWQTVRLDAIGDKISIGPFGSRMKSDCYVPSGVPVIRGTNLTGGKSFSGNWVYVSEQIADELSNCCVSAGDLVFPHRGSIGEVGIVTDEFPRYVMSSSLMKLTCDPSKADHSYVYYFFKSERGRHELLKNASQVGTPGIGQPLNSLKGIEILLPPLPEQRAIAHILGTLDDKIELNRRMNETLEAMARALFKSWFVDFEPVRAKAEGRDTGLPKEIADLFPDSFEDSELGEVPKGWKVDSFASTVEIIGGGTPKTSVPEFWNGDIPWFSVVDAPNDTDVFVIDTQKKITTTGLDGSSARMLPEGSTIISARGTVGKVALVGVPMAMNQSCYGLRDLDDSHFFTYYSTHALVETLKQRSHGSVFDTITRDTLAGITTVVPSCPIKRAFELKVAPIMQRIKVNLHESSTIAAQRDALLPKLLSGNLQVPPGIASQFTSRRTSCN